LTKRKEETKGCETNKEKSLRDVKLRKKAKERTINHLKRCTHFLRIPYIQNLHKENVKFEYPRLIRPEKVVFIMYLQNQQINVISLLKKSDI